MGLWRAFKPILEDAIRSVYCQPEGNNRFGRLEVNTGNLHLEAVLFPCFIRRFCKKDVTAEQPIMQRSQWGIHSQHPTPGLVATCHLPESGLNPQGGVLESFMDIAPRDPLQFDHHSSCSISICALSPVLLLHVLSHRRQEGYVLILFHND